MKRLSDIYIYIAIINFSSLSTPYKQDSAVIGLSSETAPIFITYDKMIIIFP